MSFDVSIQKCAGYSNEETYHAVKNSIDLLGGIEQFVQKGERILLKPNMLASKPTDKAVTTHPAVVRAVALLVKEAGGIPFVGDSPAIGGAAKVAGKCGIREVCQELSMELVDLKTPVDVDNSESPVFKRLELAKEALTADGIINIPKLKTHAQMYLTMGVKNLFGCVPGKKKVQWHFTAGVDTDFFAEMLIEVYRNLSPRLNVLDAVVSMEGNGPASGDPINTGFVAASANAVRMDRVVAEVVGAKVADIPVLKKAGDIDPDSVKLDNIKILGEQINDVRVTGMKFPPLISTNFGSFLPGILDKRLRKATTSRPNIVHSKCKKCGLCAQVCPADTISGTERVIINYDNCIRCYCCQEMCPWEAITVKEGWLKKIIPAL